MEVMFDEQQNAPRHFRVMALNLVAYFVYLKNEMFEYWFKLYRVFFHRTNLSGEHCCLLTTLVHHAAQVYMYKYISEASERLTHNQFISLRVFRINVSLGLEEGFYSVRYVYISKLIHFARACTSVNDFNVHNLVITEKLLGQGYKYDILCKTFFQILPP